MAPWGTYSMNLFKTSTGLTLIELLLVVIITLILMAMAIPVFLSFSREISLNNNTEEVINILRIARDRTIASEGDSQYGVYFSTSSRQYILFKGESHALKDPLADETHNLSRNIDFNSINLGGEQEVVFDRLNGNTSQTGNLVLKVINEPSKTTTIYIESSGKVSQSPSSSPINSRIRDSRHVHFIYSQLINTGTEKIILTFDDSPPVQEEISISNYLDLDGQLSWEGTVTVGGDDQVVKIITHRLNNPDTLFSVRRDRRYNNRALDIDIDGDTAASPNLIGYTANGTTTQGSSDFVNQPVWQ